MKALTFQGTETIRHESVDDPAIVAPGDVIVRVDLTAICGSDLHVYRGHETGLDDGTVMGHEFLGEVVEAGADVRAFPRGARVVAPFTTSCGACFYCERGLTCRCERGQLFGWVEGGRGLHGAQAELVRVPWADASLLAVPDDAPEEEVLFCGDVLSTGMFCAEMGEAKPGSTVVVLGCGPVGLMAIVGARELGCERVIAVDSVPERLELALRFGAETLDFRATDPGEAVRAATQGRGADTVLEAVGSPQATALAFDLVRPGGVVAACGVHTEPHFAFSPGDAYDKNLTYRAGRSPARHFMDRALAVVRSRKYDLGAVISHRLPMAEGPEAYALFNERREGCTKVLLSPGG